MPGINDLALGLVIARSKGIDGPGQAQVAAVSLVSGPLIGAIVATNLAAQPASDQIREAAPAASPPPPPSSESESEPDVARETIAEAAKSIAETIRTVGPRFAESAGIFAGAAAQAVGYLGADARRNELSAGTPPPPVPPPPPPPPPPPAAAPRR
jgi:hypothetical protein